MQFINDLLNFQIGTLTLQSVIGAVLVIIICILFARLVLRVLRNCLAKTSLDDNLRTIIFTILRIVLYSIATLIAADYLGIPVSSLLAVLSVAGLAVSLAIQDTLANVFAGMGILASKIFVTGDYVQIAGLEGTVINVALMNTHLRTADNKMVRIPNKDVQAAAIVNFTTEPTRRVELKVTVSYDAPTDAVKASLLKAVSRVDNVLDDPAPFAGLSAFQNSGIEFVVRVWAASAKYWDVYFALTEHVRTAFQEDGIDMTYDHVNVHMIQE